MDTLHRIEAELINIAPGDEYRLKKKPKSWQIQSIPECKICIHYAVQANTSYWVPSGRLVFLYFNHRMGRKTA